MVEDNSTVTLYASVIIPVYNAEDVLGECIESIINLDYPKDKLEIIFIDNNSEDKSFDLLKKYKGEVRVLTENKRGPAAARNKGIENAHGEIIAFTDADCKVNSDWLKNLIKPLIEDRGIGATGGKILAKRPCNSIEKYGEIIHDHNRAINLYNIPYLITMNMAIRKSCLMEVNMFDEDLIGGEDTDLSYRLNAAGCKFKYAPEAIVFHKNERSLSGLFKEGFLHGFWYIRLKMKRNRTLSKIQGKEVFGIYIKITFKYILSLLKILFLRKKDKFSLYDKIFRSGKEIGKFSCAILHKYLST